MTFVPMGFDCGISPSVHEEAPQSSLECLVDEFPQDLHDTFFLAPIRNYLLATGEVTFATGAF
jgi:hypothetical protein